MSERIDNGDPTSQTLSTAQAADVFGYPEGVLLLMIQAGDFPAPVIVAGEYRWTPEDVARADAAIDANCRAMGCPDMPQPAAGEGGR